MLMFGLLQINDPDPLIWMVSKLQKYGNIAHILELWLFIRAFSCIVYQVGLHMIQGS